MNWFKWFCEKCGIRKMKDTGVLMDMLKKSGVLTKPCTRALRLNGRGEVDAGLVKQDGKFHVPNEYRVRRGALGSDDGYGNEGAFLIPSRHRDETLTVIASDGLGWEHVSVSLGPTSKRCPSWEEMCQVKDLFWGEDVCVVQFHPARSDYVNRHKGCLHMWREVGAAIKMPPMFMV